MLITDRELPGLYHAADKASAEGQRVYFVALMFYLLLLILAAVFSFFSGDSVAGSILFAILFLVSLGILIALRVMRPDDRWYNGRAVAESVKTRAWRWMMRAAPYEQDGNPAASSKQFINDLKAILNQNRSLAGKLPTDEYMKAPISDTMNAVRSRSLDDRLAIYKSDRVRDQADWYSRKAIFNKRRSRQWFWISVSLHAAAICMLLLRINNPSLPLPGAVIATAASAVDVDPSKETQRARIFVFAGGSRNRPHSGRGFLGIQ
jgi:uncharacterized membrane protein YhaH (DUF805 family)